MVVLEADQQAAAYSTRPELMRMVFTAVPVSLLAVLVSSCLFAGVYYHQTADASVLIWLVATNLVSLARLLMYVRFRKRAPDAAIGPGWHHAMVIGSALSGAAWGVAALWFLPHASIELQVFLAFIIAGMCAGAVTTLTPIMTYLVAFVMLSAVPLFIQFLLQAIFIGKVMALMTAMFTSMLLLSARRLHTIITELLSTRHALQQSREEIRKRAMFDYLTGLPNRRMFMDMLSTEITRSVRHDRHGAVLFIDVDHFKTCNDTLGHAVGDELLKGLTGRIQSRLRNEDLFARLGGDEFVILITDIGNNIYDCNVSARQLAEMIRELMVEPFDIDGHALHVTVSIGVAVFGMRNASAAEILQRSDVAMYEAKHAGRNDIRSFEPAMQSMVDWQLKIERCLRSALDDEALEVHLQPIVDSGGETRAMEALLRIPGATRMSITTAELIETAEKRGLVNQLGDRVIRRSCEALASMPLHRRMIMCINISPQQLWERGFIDRCRDTFTDTAVDPSRVRFEITENLVIEHLDVSSRTMKQLSDLGVMFSLDDFGTGYSSLSFLQRLPVDIIKIDKSLIQNILEVRSDAAIVDAILAMADHMGIRVVAEGVESDEVFDYLKSRGCTLFQGYLFGRPASVENTLQTIHARMVSVARKA